MLVLAAEDAKLDGPTDSHDESYADKEFSKVIEEDIYDDIGDVELEGSAGLTPDSNFYFIENIVESVLVGDDPEKALEYKEEKVLELKEMLESDNPEAAEVALDRVNKYNDIIQKEVSPNIEKRVRESSKAVKGVLNSFEAKLKDDDWKDIQKGVDESLKQEDKIALAAKISRKINDLCEALSDLDPLEYSKVCKTGEDAPKWKRDLDQKLTKEQEVEARKFFGIMTQCFQNPKSCRCDDISVKPFAEQCKIIAPLAAACDDGDEAACEKMQDAGDPIDLLPDYLQEVMEEVEDKFGESKHDLHIPTECVEEGATSREDCMKVMFKIHAPPECYKALEEGKIDPKNENEARKACDKIMFELEAPQECIKAGLKDRRECERYMFKLDAPQECIDAGLDGSGRSDWKQCDAIRFKLDAPKECLDAGIDGSNRDDWKRCEAIKFKLDSPKECLDAGLTGEGRNDWKKCDAIKFRLDAPKECLDAGLTGDSRNDWRECGKIRFKLEAPKECLDAGLDGSSQRDHEECRRISESKRGVDRRDCGPDQLHICDDNGYDCKCVDSGDKGDPNVGCGAIDCKQGYHCEYGKCFPDGGSCGDCQAKCPGASRTDCVDGKCVCYDDDKGGEDWKKGCDVILCPKGTYCAYGECKSHPVSECSDGCQQECGDQNTDCREDKCVCLGYGDNGPPPSSTDPVTPPPTKTPPPDDSTPPADDGTKSDDSSTDSGDNKAGSAASDGGSDSSDSGSSDSGSDSSSSDSGSSDSGSDSCSSDCGSSDSGSDSSSSDCGSSDSGSDSGSSDSGSSESSGDAASDGGSETKE